MTPDVPPTQPQEEKPGSAYPISALLFDGSQAAISKLRVFAQSKGIKLSEPEPLPEGRQRVRFLSNDMGASLKTIFDEAKRIGGINFGIMSGPFPNSSRN